MRSGVEIWVEHEKASTLQEIINNLTSSRFIHFEGQTVNTADIVGIFSAQTMDDHTRRKNGQWRCEYDKWHDRSQECACGRQQYQKFEDGKFSE